MRVSPWKSAQNVSFHRKMGAVKTPDFQTVLHFPHKDIYRRIRNTMSYTHAISRDDQEEWLSHEIKADRPCPFYAIPKIHKNETLGSRPISPQHSYMLAPLSKALSKILIDEQIRLQGITQDTLFHVSKNVTVYFFGFNVHHITCR